MATAALQKVMSGLQAYLQQKRAFIAGSATLSTSPTIGGYADCSTCARTLTFSV